MTAEEIYEFATQNSSCFVATVDDDKPQVRGVWMYRSNPQEGIIFHSSVIKDLHQQIEKNPNVQLCFTNMGQENLQQVRISGQIEILQDKNLKAQIVEERPFLKPMTTNDPELKLLSVYRLKSPIATVWNMANNMEPKTFIEL